MLAALVISFTVNTVDLVWHGFSTPNWLNYRYSYVFSFFILTMAADAIKAIEPSRPYHHTVALRIHRHVINTDVGSNVRVSGTTLI